MSNYPEKIWQRAVAETLKTIIGELPLYVTLTLHQDEVLTEDTIIWSLPLGRVTVNDKSRVEFEPTDP